MSNSVEYYLNKGLEPKMAEYFARGRRTIIRVKANDNFSLTLTFDNGEIRIFNMLPLIQKGTVFEFLTDISVFRRVYLDEDASVCWDIDPDIDSKKVWSNKIDICPDSCYVDSIPIQEVS